MSGVERPNASDPARPNLSGFRNLTGLGRAAIPAALWQVSWLCCGILHCDADARKRKDMERPGGVKGWGAGGSDGWRDDQPNLLNGEMGECNATGERGGMNRRERQQGATMVEFALVAGLFFTLILGALQFGSWLMDRTVLMNAALEGVRVFSAISHSAHTHIGRRQCPITCSHGLATKYPNLPGLQRLLGAGRGGITLALSRVFMSNKPWAPGKRFS